MISAIVLAAGRSARFGRDKRLELIDRRPMLLITALTLKSVVADTLVVLGEGEGEHERLLLDHGIDTTSCPDARLGMGHSLAHAVAQRPHSTGWLIIPADMPFIHAATVQRILDAVRLHAIVAPVYQGRRGHPVWFEQRFFDKLCALSGDQGAQSILLDHSDDLYQIPVDDPGCVADIDYPADLVSARSVTGSLS